jgi:hypothetical protein
VGIRGGAAYGTADQAWKWRAGVTLSFGDTVYRSKSFGAAAIPFSDRRWSVAVDIYDQLNEFPLVLMKDHFFNMINALLSHEDAYDYYAARGVNAAMTYLPDPSWRVTLTGLIENQQSRTKHTEYSLLGRSKVYPDNPSIADGVLNSVKLSAKFSTAEIPGFTKNTFSSFVSVEYTDPLLKSDFSFTQFNLKLRGKISTMNYDLLFPPSFTVVLNAGSAIGHLPPQRYFSLASNVLFAGEQGTLHDVGSREFYGDQYIVCSLEYNFRRAPFALSGIKKLYESKLEFIFTGAVARSWLSDQAIRTPQFLVRDSNGWYYEAGIGISNIYDLFRVDLTYRFTQPRGLNLTLLLSDIISGLVR